MTRSVGFLSRCLVVVNDLRVVLPYLCDDALVQSQSRLAWSKKATIT